MRKEQNGERAQEREESCGNLDAVDQIESLIGSERSPETRTCYHKRKCRRKNTEHDSRFVG
jgi:hypothetical protein